MNTELSRVVGEVFHDGRVDPNTGQPYYYKVMKIYPDGCISSTRCHEDGRPYVMIVKRSADHDPHITIL